MNSILFNKIKKIKCLILDMDGVLTNGKILLSNNSNSNSISIKQFDVKDGLGLIYLNQIGIHTSIITNSDININIKKRLLSLNIKDIFYNQKNKNDAYRILKKQYNFKNEDMAYVGDDWPDLTIMKQVSITFAPADAVDIIKHYADYICNFKGGHGAVREICNIFFKVHNKYDELINNYLNL